MLVFLGGLFGVFKGVLVLGFLFFCCFMGLCFFFLFLVDVVMVFLIDFMGVFLIFLGMIGFLMLFFLVVCFLFCGVVDSILLLIIGMLLVENLWLVGLIEVVCFLGGCLVFGSLIIEDCFCFLDLFELLLLVCDIGCLVNVIIWFFLVCVGDCGGSCCDGFFVGLFL